MSTVLRKPRLELLLSPALTCHGVREELVGKLGRGDPKHCGHEAAQPGVRYDQRRARIPAHVVLFETLEVRSKRFTLSRGRGDDIREVEYPGNRVLRAGSSIFARPKARAELIVGAFLGKGPSIDRHEIVGEPRMVDLEVSRRRFSGRVLHSLDTG